LRGAEVFREIFLKISHNLRSCNRAPDKISSNERPRGDLADSRLAHHLISDATAAQGSAYHHHNGDLHAEAQSDVHAILVNRGIIVILPILLVADYIT